MTPKGVRVTYINVSYMDIPKIWQGDTPSVPTLNTVPLVHGVFQLCVLYTNGKPFQDEQH